MYKRPQPQYDLIFLGILTFLATATWVGFETFRNFGKSPDFSIASATEFTRPLTPTLDASVLDKLQARISISPEEISTPSPTPKPTSSPLASPTGTASAKPR